MTIVGGLDLHRGQLTFDYLDQDSGEVTTGRIVPADRLQLRAWLERFAGGQQVAFALEGCTGWRYVVEELQRAGIAAHLAEPAETAGLRGPKRRAKTDRADARHLRELLLGGRVPESWIAPTHVLEARATIRLYKDLLDELQEPSAERAEGHVLDWALAAGKQPRRSGQAATSADGIAGQGSPNRLLLSVACWPLAVTC